MRENRFENSGCARLFVWAAKAKFTMGLFFAGYVLLFLLLGVLIEGMNAALGFFTALEMVFACFFIGLLQQLILPMDKHTRARKALWVISGVGITLLFGLVFQWFKAFPAWCLPAFAAAIAIGMLGVIFNDHLQLYNETKQLNRKLAQFQSDHEGNAERQ